MLFKRRKSELRLSLFFATDIHGSDVCFRKFVSARTVYEVEYLILGGDLTGKMIVPLIHDKSGYDVDFAGQRIRALEDEREDLERSISNAGFYPMLVESDQIEQYADRAVLNKSFQEFMIERLHEWNDYALKKGVPEGSILVAPGNDDPFEIDPVLEGLTVFRLVEGQMAELTHGTFCVPLVSTGFANPTPWRTHRELEEDALERRLRGLLEGVDMERAILNVHVPPYDTGLDIGADVEPESVPTDVRQRKSLGTPLTKPVGSTAVRHVIEELQPMLTLHGHIHESRAIVKIGRSVCVNPGSDYGEGVLRGVLVRLGDEGVLTCQLTSG